MTDNTPPAATEGNFDVREALDHLDTLNESGRIHYADYVALHDMVSRIEVRAPRTSTVNAENTPANAWKEVADALLGSTEVCFVKTVTAEQISDPNTIPDDVADAAQIEHYEFVFGQDVQPLTRRQLGVSRQAWKCAIAVAIDKMNKK